VANLAGHARRPVGGQGVEDMTQAQLEAFQKAEDLLKEHFLYAVIAVAAEVAEDESKRFRMMTHGGYYPAQGLIHDRQRELDKEADKQDDEHLTSE
jgi:uncharacterized heparinase superfamily protein